MGSIYRKIYLMCIVFIFATLAVSTVFNIHTAKQVLRVEKEKRARTIVRTLQDKCKYAFTLVNPKTCECFIDRQSLDNFIKDIRKNIADVENALILDTHGTILSSLNSGDTGKTRIEHKLDRPGIPRADQIMLKEIYHGKALDLTAGIILDKVRVGTVVMQFSLDSIAEEIRHITIRALFIGALFFIIGIFISRPIVRTIVGPIQELNINARKIGNGDLDAKVKVNSNDEVGELAAAFNLMAVKLKQSMSDLKKRMDELERSEAMLRESEKKYRDIFENAIEGLFQIDADGSFLKANQALANFLGYDSKDALLSSNFYLFDHENFASMKKYREIMSCLEEGREVSGLEAEIIKKDKSTITVFLSVRPVTDANGHLVRYEGSLIDITERKQMEQAELEAQAARAASEAKSDFLANMSHEIRTPMNAVMGFTELALRTGLDDEQTNYLRKIQNASITLLGLINDILDFSKIEAGKMEIESIDFNLHEVIDSVIDLISIKAHEKNLELLLDISSQIPCMLVGDPLRLAQVLTNLLNNAVKFTNQGEIILRVESTDTKKDDASGGTVIRFSVQDSGIGLNDREMKKIFEKFSQADETTTRKYGGTGLGLAISKLLSEMMGGEISVTSSPGKGSTFGFTACFDVSHQTSTDLIVPAILHGKHILVIDDNKTSLQLIAKVLRSFDFQVTPAASGDEALTILGGDAVKPFCELVLVDWSMPFMDGVETTEQIRTKFYNASVPVVLMAAPYVQETIKYRAKQAGVTIFLNKPVSPSSLLYTITKILAPDDLSSKRSQFSQDTGEKRLQGAKILLAEDNPINQEVALNLLKSFGVAADVVENGQKAVEAVQTEKYDAVLMDVHMPVMNGYDAALKIRENYDRQELPIIAMTADAMKSSRDKAYSVGMNAHLTKPIMVKQLLTALCKWIKPDPKRSLTIISDTKEKQQTTKPELRHMEDLPGIDFKTAMEYLDGNEALFEELLSQFYKEHGEDKALIAKKMENKEYEKAGKLVHAIKGVSGNLGCKRLYSAAGVLNKNLKQGQKLSESVVMEFFKAMDEVFHTIKNHMNILRQEKSDHAASEKSASTDKIRSVVMIVDDEPININIAGEILRPYYDIVVATSGRCALEKAVSVQPPDLILLDIGMPGLDGYEVCKRLKNNEDTKDIPVIFLTGRSSIQDEARGLEAGAVDYITKPFNPVIARARVKTHLKFHEYGKRFKKQSLIDGLTGIHNRRYFEQNFEKEWLHALRSCSSLSVVMIDIDFFKKFNDRYGHLSGDVCLQKIANVLSTTLKRPRDFVARFGGEEFVCVLPDTDFAGAGKLAELLRKAVEYLHIPHADSETSPWVTISLGTASIIPRNDRYTSRDLLKSADTALYKVKETTRNNVKSVELLNAYA